MVRLRIRDGGAEHAGHEPEVGGEAVVEAVHDVAQEAAGARLVPGLAAAAGDAVERRGVLGRLLGEHQRLVAAGHAAPCGAVHVEVRLHLAPLLGQQHGQEEPGPEPAAEEGQQTRACRRTMVAGRAPVLRQQRRPDLEVAVLHLGEPAIDALLRRVRLGVGEHAVEIGSVGLVLPVVMEGLEVGRAARRGGSGSGHGGNIEKPGSGKPFSGRTVSDQATDPPP
jgi:hypothetical protein